MGKNNFLVLFVFVLILSTVGGGWYYYTSTGKVYGDPIKAVPQSAVVVYKGKQWQSLIYSYSSSHFGEGVSTTSNGSSFFNSVEFIDSLLSAEPKFRKVLSENSFYVSLHATGANSRDLLFILPSAGAYSEGDVKKIILRAFDDAVFTSHIFQGSTIVSVTSSSQNLINYAFSEGIFMATANVVLLEEAIFNLQRNERHQLRRMLEESKDEQIVVNFNRSGDFLSPFVSGHYKEIPATFADAGRYDINITKDKLSIIGNLRVEDTAKFLNLLKDQKPVKISAQEFLPSRTSFMFAMGVSDFPNYFNKRINKTSGLKNDVASFEKSYKTDIYNEWAILVGKEFTLAVTETATEEHAGAFIGLVDCIDSEGLAEKLVGINEAGGTTYYRDHKININRSRLPHLLFGESWKVFDECFFTTHENKLLFATDLNNLQRLLDELLAGQTLSRTVEYVKFSENLLTESNMLVFVNSNRGRNLPVQYLHSSYVPQYRSNFNAFSKFHYSAYQLSNEGRTFYNQFISQHGQERRDKIEMLWRLQLDTLLHGKPHLVVNHNNNTNEILVSDVSGNLYLVNSGGTLQWKKRLSTPIEGEVYQVDLYRNNKLQYLFATSTHIHLVDRNGDDVANYPIRIGTPIQGGLKLVEQGNQPPVYFLTGTDNRITGYRLDGRTLTGWGPKIIEASLAGEVKTFDINGKPYIYGVSRAGDMYVWDITGKPEVKPINLGSKFNNTFFAELSETVAQTRILSSDTAGNVYSVKLNGEVQKVNAAGLSGNHSFYSFDISGDKNNDFIFTDAAKLSIFDRTGRERASITLHDSIPLNATFYRLGERYLIGYATPQTGKIHLQTLDGIDAEGFPLNGDLPFLIKDVTGNGNRELVTGLRNSLILYNFRN